MSLNANKGRTVMCQGRIVWIKGDLMKGQLKRDYNTKQPVMDPKTGQQKVEWGFGLSIPKSALQQIAPGQPGEVWAAMHEEAFTLFPSRQIPPAFAMKFRDGDGIDDKGIPFAQREGYAGCIVLACTTNIQPKFYRWEGGTNVQITEGIKCGDFVNVQLNIKAHPAVGKQKAGLYVNPKMVQFLAYGKEIINTPDPMTVFGNQAPPIPAGGSAVPFAPTGFVPPQEPQQQYGQQVVQNLQQQYQQPAPPPQAPAAPHYGVLPPQQQQQFQQQPQQPVHNYAQQFQPQQPMVNAQGNVSPGAPAAIPFSPGSAPTFVPPAQGNPGNGIPMPTFERQ